MISIKQDWQGSSRVEPFATKSGAYMLEGESYNFEKLSFDFHRYTVTCVNAHTQNTKNRMMTSNSTIFPQVQC